MVFGDFFCLFLGSVFNDAFEYDGRARPAQVNKNKLEKV